MFSTLLIFNLQMLTYQLSKAMQHTNIITAYQGFQGFQADIRNAMLLTFFQCRKQMCWCVHCFLKFCSKNENGFHSSNNVKNVFVTCFRKEVRKLEIIFFKFFKELILQNKIVKISTQKNLLCLQYFKKLIKAYHSLACDDSFFIWHIILHYEPHK